MQCPCCKDEFTPLTVVQKYCSIECGRLYRQKHSVRYPAITFSCAWCGRSVTTEEHTGGQPDKRTKFCSVACEKKFWRHPEKAKRAAMS